MDTNSRFGKSNEIESNISHSKRLKFLGDAVMLFVSSVHLFLSFPHFEEEGLHVVREAIVQKQHLTLMAKVILIILR